MLKFCLHLLVVLYFSLTLLGGVNIAVPNILFISILSVKVLSSALFQFCLFSLIFLLSSCSFIFELWSLRFVVQLFLVFICLSIYWLIHLSVCVFTTMSALTNIYFRLVMLVFTFNTLTAEGCYSKTLLGVSLCYCTFEDALVIMFCIYKHLFYYCCYRGQCISICVVSSLEVPPPM